MATQVSNSHTRITILFGPPSAIRSELQINTVLVVPLADSWNDFGFRTRTAIRIRLAGMAVPLATEALIGFITDDPKKPNGVERLEKLVSDAGGMTVPAKDSHRFFMMLPEMKMYRQLVRGLGAEQASAVLVTMRDIVAAGEQPQRPDWVDSALQTEVFNRSFLRNAEAYFAYKNAGAVLRGLEYEEFRKMSSNLAITFQLAGRANPHALAFRFDHQAPLPKRIAVVIGKNGVGKSQALGRMARAALTGHRAFVDGDTGERVALNRILAFAPTNEAGSVFPSDRRKRAKVWYRRFALNRSTPRRRGSGISDVLLQVARSNESLGAKVRWDILLEALPAINNWEQLCLPVQDTLRPPIPLHRLLQGGEQAMLDNFSVIDPDSEPVRVIDGKAYPLSSGEISFVRFAAQASLWIENGSLLLLDEPETHLHPNFISRFVGLLDRLLQQTGSAAIIATHSAYFVREVFQDQVTVLRQDHDGFVRSEVPALRTFGADIGAISYFVFGEDVPSQLASEVETRLRGQFHTWEALYATHKHELSLEMLGDLRQSMEDEENV